MSESALVIGLGNPLMGDDGLGLAALERLAADWVLPPGVELVDGGTWGLNLLPLLEAADQVLFLDAVDVGKAPGEPVELTGERAADAARNQALGPSDRPARGARAGAASRRSPFHHGMPGTSAGQRRAAQRAQPGASASGSVELVDRGRGPAPGLGAPAAATGLPVHA